MTTERRIIDNESKTPLYVVARHKAEGLQVALRRPMRHGLDSHVKLQNPLKRSTLVGRGP